MVKPLSKELLKGQWPGKGKNVKVGKMKPGTLAKWTPKSKTKHLLMNDKNWRSEYLDLKAVL